MPINGLRNILRCRHTLTLVTIKGDKMKLDRFDVKLEIEFSKCSKDLLKAVEFHRDHGNYFDLGKCFIDPQNPKTIVVGEIYRSEDK